MEVKHTKREKAEASAVIGREEIIYVNVPSFKGAGMEVSGGSAHNLAEAEFIVATYMYLRLK